MSNIVEQIITAGKSQLSTTLGASYSELDYVIELEKNNFRNRTTRYGFIPLGADTGESVINKVYTLDHSFQIILTQPTFNRQNDAGLISATNTLYDKMDDIFKDFMNKKLGLNTIILNIQEPSIEEPEYLEDNDLVALRGNVVIKYRQPLN